MAHHADAVCAELLLSFPGSLKFGGMLAGEGMRDQPPVETLVLCILCWLRWGNFVTCCWGIGCILCDRPGRRQKLVPGFLWALPLTLFPFADFAVSCAIIQWSHESSQGIIKPVVGSGAQQTGVDAPVTAIQVQK